MANFRKKVGIVLLLIVKDSFLEVLGKFGLVIVLVVYYYRCIVKFG